LSNNFREEFTIPELPSGNELCFVLVAPWDDPFYVGLSGIEIFTEKGTRAPIDSVSTNGITSFGDIDKVRSSFRRLGIVSLTSSDCPLP
jgi:hypothetical protein